MDEREDRIRARAHQIWEEEGRPHGREEAHWDMAAEQVAIQDNQRLATRPNPLADDRQARAASGEPAEPLVAVENQGEFPTLTDQGEEATAPRRRRAGEEKPLAPPRPAPKPSGRRRT